MAFLFMEAGMNKKEKKRVVLKGLPLKEDHEIHKRDSRWWDQCFIFIHWVLVAIPEAITREDLYEVVMRPIRRIEALSELLDNDDF